MKTDVTKIVGTGSSNNIVLENTTTVPVAGTSGQMFFLTQQDGANQPGPYIHNGSAWNVIPSELPPSWWDPTALVVIDAENTSQGTNLTGTGHLTNYVATDLECFGTIAITDAASRSTPNSIIVQSGGAIGWNRPGNPVPWPNSGADWTIEYVVRHISGSAGLNNNCFTTLNNRFQITGGETNGQIGMLIYNNGSSPKRNGGYVGVNTTDWVHVAYTYQAATNQYRFYLDGILRQTHSWTPQSVSLAEHIGLHNGATYLDRYQLIPSRKYTANFTPDI